MISVNQLNVARLYPNYVNIYISIIYFNNLWMQINGASGKGTLRRNYLHWNIIIIGDIMNVGTIFYPWPRYLTPYQNMDPLHLRKEIYFTPLKSLLVKRWLLLIHPRVFPVKIYLQDSSTQKNRNTPTSYCWISWYCSPCPAKKEGGRCKGLYVANSVNSEGNPRYIDNTVKG